MRSDQADELVSAIEDAAVPFVHAVHALEGADHSGMAAAIAERDERWHELAFAVDGKCRMCDPGTCDLDTADCFCGEPDREGVAHRAHECVPIGSGDAVEVLAGVIAQCDEVLDLIDDTDRDWKAEARGLGRMLLSIAERYREAKRALGGDSELLALSIAESEQYVLGSLTDALAEGGTE